MKNSVVDRSEMSPAKVAVRLEAVRQAVGMDKGEFADASEIDRSSYSKIIKGEKPLKSEMAFVISARWGVPMDFFYRGTFDNLPAQYSKNIIAALTRTDA